MCFNPVLIPVNIRKSRISKNHKDYEHYKFLDDMEKDNLNYLKEHPYSSSHEISEYSYREEYYNDFLETFLPVKEKDALPLPITKEDINPVIKSTYILADCGKCFACRKKRQNMWTIRVANEYQMNYSKIGFVMLTLTYADNSNNSLDYTDFQKYMKRLRKSLPKDYPYKIKYMVVGEYGFKSERKHFHVLIFGLNKRIYDRYCNNIWDKGFYYCKNANIMATHYLLKYSFKQQFKDNQYYKDKGMTPPMFHVSKGFGLDYLKEYHDKILNQGYISYNNYKFGIPRYYREKLKEFGIVDNDYFYIIAMYNELDNMLLMLKPLNVNLEWFCQVYREYDRKKLLALYQYLIYTYNINTNTFLYSEFRKRFKEAI